jgi:protoheme IX farnesyltransferase
MPHNSETISLSKSNDMLQAYWQLTKPGITVMVLISMMVGYFMGSISIGFNILTFFHVALGTFLTASGTSAYNQYIERNLDKMMKRTSKRPLPMEKISASNAFLFSTGLIISGLAYLIVFVNPVAALMSAVTTILYLGFYTPLKRVSFLNVFVGSIPGALPPVGGWAAATGTLNEPGMWILFAILFLWQIPHVIAIAWLCNEDYTKAGFVMLPQKDTKGHFSSWSSLISALMLIPVAASLSFLDIANHLFLVLSVVSGLAFTIYAVFHLKEKSSTSARKLMFASLFYQPFIWIALVIDILISI